VVKVKALHGDEDPLDRLVALATRTWGEPSSTSAAHRELLPQSTHPTPPRVSLSEEEAAAATPSGHGFSAASRAQSMNDPATSDEAWCTESLERSVFVSHSRRDPASLNATYVYLICRSARAEDHFRAQTRVCLPWLHAPCADVTLQQPRPR
jgi:hypothetical protein